MEIVFRKISVIGLGYIGLPTATLFASNGIEVVGVDINESIVDKINNGQVHIVEKDLEKVVEKAVREKKLRASIKIEESDAFIIAVPTPFKEGFKPDLTFVENAIRNVAPFLQKGNLIILESTSPVGTTEKMTELLASLRSDLNISENPEKHDIHIAYCPERVLPGNILHELVFNDRVIGGISSCCAEYAKNLYKTFVKGECFLTDSKTAEMTKLTENAYRDVNIAFANELSIICDKLNIDVWKLIHFANRHPRVKILNPGAGVGGHCIAVDPWFIVDSAPDEARLIKTARIVNDNKPLWVVQKVLNTIRKIKDTKQSQHEIQIACLGLSYKANIDDLRESPAIKIVEKLAEEKGCKISIVEPFLKELPYNLSDYDNIRLDTIEKAIGNADIIVVLVDHDVFKTIAFDKLKDCVIIDTRGISKH